MCPIYKFVRSRLESTTNVHKRFKHFIFVTRIFRSCFLEVIYSMTTVAAESFYIKSYSVTQCKSVHTNVHVSVR